jgi:hypothetical protein
LSARRHVIDTDGLITYLRSFTLRTTLPTPSPRRVRGSLPRRSSSSVTSAHHSAHHSKSLAAAIEHD